MIPMQHIEPSCIKRVNNIFSSIIIEIQVLQFFGNFTVRTVLSQDYIEPAKSEYTPVSFHDIFHTQ